MSRHSKTLLGIVAGTLLATTSLPLAAAPAVVGPTLIKDINFYSLRSDIFTLVDFRGILYFMATDGINGQELWRSDGTAAGTYMLKDINPGDTDSSFDDPTVLNDVLYFSASTDNEGRELWRTDGTADGTTMVKDINPGTGSGISQSELTAFNGELFFHADNGVDGSELWKSDGTADGTVMVKDINSSGNGEPRGLIATSDTLFFQATDGTNGTELWKSNGTENGTVLVKDIFPGSPAGSPTLPNNGSPEFLTAVGNTLYFRATDGTNGTELWKSNGTEGGTQMVKNIDPSGDGNPESLTAANGVLYFSATNGADGRELWKSNGTDGGTEMVKNINPSGDGNPKSLTIANGVLYFSATNGADGRELWKSDGTADGTVMVIAIRTGTSTAVDGNVDFGVMNGAVFFRARNNTDGYELWKSDGTTGGTVMVKDIFPGLDSGNPNNSNPEFFTTAGSTLFFRAETDEHGTELWRTDGTEDGTVMVKDIRALTSNSTPTSLTPAGSQLFFTADHPAYERELWVTDGTTNNTRLVKDICPGPNEGVDSHSEADSDQATRRTAAVGSRLFFIADNCINGQELWVTDGTEDGTEMITDLTPGSDSSNFRSLTPLGSRLLFFFESPTYGWELWTTDGTADGTEIVKDINPSGNSPLDSVAGQRTYPVGGHVYFVASNGVNGYELWKSNGTEAGTTMVANLAIESDATPKDSFKEDTRLSYAHIGDTLYFAADATGTGATLWKTDGTAAGTTQVVPGSGVAPRDVSYLTAVGSTLYYAADDGVHGLELWKSDGTAEGTTLVKNLNPLSADAIQRNAQNFPLFHLDSTLYFAATDGQTGRELWKTDGTADGTLLVADVNPGNRSSNPEQARFYQGSLYFVVEDPDNDVAKRLARHDGSGFTIVDFDSMAETAPSWLTIFEDKMFVTATTLRHGKELWAFTLAPPPATDDYQEPTPDPDPTPSDPDPSTADPDPSPTQTGSTPAASTTASAVAQAQAVSTDTTSTTIGADAGNKTVRATARSPKRAQRNLPATGAESNLAVVAALTVLSGAVAVHTARRRRRVN